MKKNKFAMISMTFILGAFFGISLISVLSFTKPVSSPAPNQDITIIDTIKAHQYFSNYYDGAVTIDSRFKGFLVDTLQLRAMNNLITYDRSLIGFRLYMGKGDNDERISLVVGVSARFSDAWGRIYRTTSRNSNPCPFVCDESSPIIRGLD